MVTLQELVEIGFTEKEAKKLMGDPYFRSRFAHWPKERFQKRIDEIVSVYGKENRKRILKATVGFSRFVTYDHRRALNEAMKIYGKANKSRIIEATLKFPPFAGHNHERLLRQLTKIGRKAGITKQQCIDLILSIPVQAGLSRRRNIAVLDAFRNLLKGKELPPEKLLRIYKSCFSRSPYVLVKLPEKLPKNIPRPKYLKPGKVVMLREILAKPMKKPSHRKPR
jgi:hypothetical protein